MSTASRKPHLFLVHSNDRTETATPLNKRSTTSEHREPVRGTEDIHSLLHLLLLTDGFPEKQAASVSFGDCASISQCKYRAAARMLHYLRLADKCNSSPLGWRVNHRLFEVLKKRQRRLRPDTGPSETDLTIIRLLMRTPGLYRKVINGNSTFTAQLFCVLVLLRLGLLAGDDISTATVTSELALLIEKRSSL